MLGHAGTVTLLEQGCRGGRWLGISARLRGGGCDGVLVMAPWWCHVPLVTVRWLWHRYLIGEEGYCLTSLQSALSYVESLQ